MDEIENEEVLTEAPETPDIPSEPTSEEERKPPTPEDSVLEAIQIARGEKLEKDGEAVEVEAPKEEAAEEPEVTKDKEPDIQPPQRLSAEGKEWFMRLPKEGKKEYAAAINHLEGLATKTLQDARRAEGEAKDVIEAIKPYMSQWGIRGVAPAQAIRQLAAANQILAEKREAGIVELANSMRADKKKLIALLSGESTSQQSSDPQISSLTKELGELKAWKQQYEAQGQQQEQARIQQTSQAIAQEIGTVRNELLPNGKFKYPKLHDAQYLAQIEPLIFNLWQTHGGKLSWADATKRAVHAVEGTSPSPSPQDPRLSRTNKQHEVERAKAASVSVRGRGSAPLLALNTKDVPRKAEDTVRMVLEHLNRGE